MILLQVQNISKSFGAKSVLSNIKLELQTNDRVAIVGRNGAGKSTLLKIISNQMSHDEGSIMIPKGVTFGYLEQHTGLQSELTLWEEMMSVFSELLDMEKKIRNLEKQLSDEAVYSDEVKFEKASSEYDRLRILFEERGGYKIEADVRGILHGLNFPEEMHHMSIDSLSGGQKTRLALGKLLLQSPDILILDEPTNHLDIDTLTWLEQYLQNYKGSILIVSHDRYFLDKVVNYVYEINHHKCKKYHGNYSAYIVTKEEEMAREVKLFEKQQEEIAKLEDFVQKNITRASTTKRAQSRRKQLEKMDKLDRPLNDLPSAKFSFNIEKQSGNHVLSIQNAHIGYDGNKMNSNPISFSITRGESIALVGHNGVGKTTLLKTIMDKIPLIDGVISFGANVSVSYYDQEQAEMKSNKTVLQELWDDFPQMMEREVRTVLGSFLFRGDDVEKPVHLLSGGEKARLTLSKIMLQKSNVLIMDEPTNHLDIESKEVLEEALISYPGTILFVSHDRFFINRIATKIVELTNEKTTVYLGDYDYYLEKQAEWAEIKRIEEEESPTVQKESVKKEGKKSFEAEKELKKIERQKQRKLEETEANISALEEEIEVIEEQLCDPAIFQDYEKVAELNTQLEEKKQQLTDLFEQWEELA